MTRTLKSLERWEQQLMNADRRTLDPGDPGWRGKVPGRGGVYAIWNKRGRYRPVYVGETANLCERFGDLERTVNHTFRRTLRGYRGIAEAELNAYMRRNFDISCMAMGLGRKELEEFLVCKWNTIEFNTLPARYWRSESFALAR